MWPATKQLPIQIEFDEGEIPTPDSRTFKDVSSTTY
jgi:hypothetical protein